MSRRVIFTEQAPRPLGAYAQAVQWERLISVTGQVARDPYSAGQLPPDSVGSEEVAGDVCAQTRQALLNVQAILRAAGADLASVLKTTCYLANMADFAAFNEVYGEFFPLDPPARSTIGVGLVPPCLVMIEAMAVCPDVSW